MRRRSQRRQFVLSVPMTSIPAGAVREFSVYPPQPFVMERLVVPRLPDDWWWKVKRATGAIAYNFVFCIPIILHWLKTDESLWYSLRFPKPDDRALIDIKVGGVSQFVVHDDGEPNVVSRAPLATGIMMDCFHPEAHAPQLLLNIANMDNPITLVVKNFSKKEQPFQAALMGYIES